MLRIALCDDDLEFLEVFQNLIIKSFADTGLEIILTSFSNGKSLLEDVEKNKTIFDVIFLDVEMPEVNGFQVAHRLRSIQPAFILIFTTYQEHQSREGYLYGAFRYVFKNNLSSELKEAIAGIVKKISEDKERNEDIIFKCRISGVLEDIMVSSEDILYLKREKSRRVILKTVFSEYELLTKPLSKYTNQLAPPNFQPVLRNFIVNFNHVQNFTSDSFILTGNSKVPIGVNREVRKILKAKYLTFLKERL